MLKLIKYFCLLYLVAPSLSANTGVVELDEISFNKMLNTFEAVIVKFDTAYPYGDKHVAFVGLGKEASEIDNVLVAQVGIKDYGEKENAGFLKKYGMEFAELPYVKLFVKGKKEPYTFTARNGFTTDELRKFIREKSSVYFPLPGCYKELDELATKFMKEQSKRNEILAETEETIARLEKEGVTNIMYYVTLMKKVIERGDNIINLEHERGLKLMSGKMSADARKGLEQRFNILLTYKSLVVKRDEL